MSAMTENRMRQAVKNLDAALETNRRFPVNVFQGRWDAILFFDQDLLFEANSVFRFKALLACEDGALVCLRNLDIACDEGNSEDKIFLDKEILGETYWAQLRSPEPGSGFLYRMDRYGCTSDVGRWCIYFERNNEIAVIAVRGIDALGQFAPALETLQALPIKQAIEKPSSYGLSPRGVPEEWRNELLQEYAFNREPPQQS
jgi:hypothetical protein